MSKKELIISKKDVREYDHAVASAWNTYSPEFHRWNDPAGNAEFRLYAYLSEKVNDSIILEVGTRHGGSTCALAANDTNKVISYDILHWDTTHNHLKKDNVDLRIGNFMEDETIDYSKVSIIMIDVDPHDGIQEPPMIKFLEEKGWKGLLLLDDITDEWPAIKEMWDAFPYEKYDLTDIGHWSGTGLINFGKTYNIKIVD
jgi:hypothetical protein